MKIFLIQTIFLLFGTCLFSQTKYPKYSLEGSLIFSGGRVESSNYLFNHLIGTGFSIEVKREIYKDDINSLSFGICNQFLQRSLNWQNEGDNTKPSRLLISSFKDLGHGINLSNRFNGKFNKFNLFLDLQLKSLFHWVTHSNSELEERDDSTFWGSLISSHKLSTKFNFRQPVFYFSFQPGIEFNRKKKRSVCISLKYEKSVHEVNREISFSPLISNYPGVFINNFGISIGTRF